MESKSLLTQVQLSLVTLAIAISLLQEELLWKCQPEDDRDEDASLPKKWGKAGGAVFMSHTSRCWQGRAHC